MILGGEVANIWLFTLIIQYTKLSFILLWSNSDAVKLISEHWNIMETWTQLPRTLTPQHWKDGDISNVGQISVCLPICYYNSNGSLLCRLNGKTMMITQEKYWPPVKTIKNDIGLTKSHILAISISKLDHYIE